MKKSTIPFALLLVSLVSCNTTPTHLSNEEFDWVSWAAFCEEYGYDAQTDYGSDKAINAYLDCWRGSVAEEKALNKLGIILRQQ